jgi:hypothetical protein
VELGAGSGLGALEFCTAQVRMVEQRALELRRSEISFAELGADQHRTFQMAGAKGDGLGSRLDLCFAVKFGVVDRVEVWQHEAV